MSGEQVAFVDYFSKKDFWLHVGGIPKEYDKDFIEEIPGFTGCVENIKVSIFQILILLTPFKLID